MFFNVLDQNVELLKSTVIYFSSLIGLMNGGEVYSTL